MGFSRLLFGAGLLVESVRGGTSSLSIPETRPRAAAALDPAPVAVSLEFFAFPSYFKNVTPTFQCLDNLKEVTGFVTPVRVGGTTQDRAVYDPDLKAYVSYSVPSSTAAPTNLTYGPSFMKLAGTYLGLITMGLNRGHDNLTNTIEAAKVAVANIPSLKSIELGNEPDLYASNGQQIATNLGQWNPQLDAASEDQWQIAVGDALRKKNIIQAGNFVSNPPTWGAESLVKYENSTAIPYIKQFSHHDYPQSGGLNSTTVNLTKLMSHAGIVSNVAVYVADVAAATSVGKPYVMGETNSVSGGGAYSISSTFGAALWLLDYTLRLASIDVRRTYFHHGTIGACAYCWWGNLTVHSPYYGAYAAASAMAGGTHIVALDDGLTNYASYLIYSGSRPIRAMLLNSDYYDGTGVRPDQTFVLHNVRTPVVTAKRLTALAATSSQDMGVAPTFAGQSFVNETCFKTGGEHVESVYGSNGTVTFVLKASEALLVNL